MTNPSLPKWSFPSASHLIRAKWAPLYFEPIPGSGERITVAVAVLGDDGSSQVVPASGFDALSCLFPSSIGRIRIFIKAAIDALAMDLEQRQEGALANPTLALEGFHLGAVREAMGESLASVARSWLLLSSSLVVEGRSEDSDNARKPASDRGERGDKLPVIVCKEVLAKNPMLVSYFREDLQKGGRRSNNDLGASANVDFVGRSMAANFCTLSASPRGVEGVQARLWSIDSFRKVAQRQMDYHELLVRRPLCFTLPVERALGALEQQAKRADITLRVYTDVSEMVDRVLKAEKAA